MNRRAFLAALLTPALATVLAGGGAARAASLDDIVAGGVLRVAVYRDFPPFSFDDNGTLRGIDVDLAREIGKGLGVRVAFMPLTPADDVDGDLRNAVWKGHFLGGGTADLMLHVPYDRELASRNGNAVLFGPYYTERLAWAAADAPPASTLAIQAERIGVENDGLADLYLASLQGGRLRSRLIHYRDTPTAAHALRRGEVDAIYGPQSELDWALAGSSVAVQPLPAPGLPKPQWEIGMATKEGLRDLMWAVGDQLTALRKDGRLAEIFRRYQVTYRPPDEH